MEMPRPDASKDDALAFVADVAAGMLDDAALQAKYELKAGELKTLRASKTIKQAIKAERTKHRQPRPAQAQSATAKRMDNIVPFGGGQIILGGVSIELTSDIGRQFVVCCTRAAEGLVEDQEIMEVYEISAADWQNIAKNAALGRAIRAERDRRVRTGQAAKEAAAKHFVRAPNILGAIMDSEQQNTRHRIEAIKELRQTATPESPNNQAQSDRFVIHIDLSGGSGDNAEILHFDKAIKIDVNDTVPAESLVAPGRFDE
jgi:hypothetical protein